MLFGERLLFRLIRHYTDNANKIMLEVETYDSAILRISLTCMELMQADSGFNSSPSWLC